MAIEVVSKRRKNGVYYTPSELADCLAEPLIDRSNLAVFDPAYGEGSLLLAAEKIYEKRFATSHNGNLQLFGCDIVPINGLLSHLPDSHLTALDFFEYPDDNKFDVILMNPPYVRHHYLSNDRIGKYQSLLSEYCALSQTSDLWAYFLVKSVLHLRNGGSIGAILPWSFLQADYARNLRQWLSKLFGEIKLLILRQSYFRNANERVVLVWLRGYRETCRRVSIAEVDAVDDHVNYTDLSIHRWLSAKVVFNQNGDLDEILTSYVDQFGFSMLGDHADVKLGVVTGANKFFVLLEGDAERSGFTTNNMIPVLTDSRKLSGFLSSENITSKRLIVINETEAEKFKDYILKGEESGIHQRYHPRHRNPWFMLKVGQIPDAFFPYRMSLYPYLIRNDMDAQSTNSVHRVYFDNLSETQIRWLQVSFLSVASQLSLESNSRIYGKGVLKVEPNSLKKAIIFQSNDLNINSVYQVISGQLRNGAKVEAVKTATDFMNSVLGIPTSVASLAKKVLHELQDRRLNNGQSLRRIL